MVNKFPLIATAVSILLTVSLFNVNNKNKHRADRFEDNYASSIEDNAKLTIKFNEMNDNLYSTIDSLSNELSIKPKQVTKYIKISTVDTMYMIDTIYEKVYFVDSNKYSFKKDTGCFVIEGIVNTKAPSIAFTRLSYNNDVDYLVYLERKEWEWFIFKSKLFGRKIAQIKTFSECGDVKSTEVEIIKK